MLPFKNLSCRVLLVTLNRMKVANLHPLLYLADVCMSPNMQLADDFFYGFASSLRRQDLDEHDKSLRQWTRMRINDTRQHTAEISEMGVSVNSCRFKVPEQGN